MIKQPPLVADVGVEILRASSQHPGGVNVAYADGSVKFTNELIKYHVIQHLMTLDGRRSDVPQPWYLKTEADMDP
jgi:prepilin-type processing-associated H-X9-DG protein